ncbi:hypothetical protein ACFL2Q_06880 [Thermodesulfobacteriota bacterium]
MPKGYRLRSGPAVIYCLALTIVLLTWTTAVASEGDVVGFSDAKGTFIPKAAIVKTKSEIRVRKIDPKDKFKSLKLRFVFKGAKKPGSMERASIQWEKKPGKMGKVWPIETHRGFNKQTKVFTAPWEHSFSFIIKDRSRKNLFGEGNWARTVKIWLDGKPLKGRKTVTTGGQTKFQEPKPKASASPHVPDKPRIRQQSATAGPTTARPAVRSRAPQSPVNPIHIVAARDEGSGKAQALTAIDRANHAILEKKIDGLRKRLAGIERELAAAQTWFYWGPLIALTLSVIFTSVTLCFVYVRVSRGRNMQMPSSPRINGTRFRPQGRFRDAG